MKEDLNFSGADYNLLSTFFIIGYIIGQVPSQLILTRGSSLTYVHNMWCFFLLTGFRKI
jgi:ACS family pantothenate transporter-like MFS transporter